MNHKIEKADTMKKEWARPELTRLEAGAAESSHNSVPDGGGGLQAS